MDAACSARPSLPVASLPRTTPARLPALPMTRTSTISQFLLPSRRSLRDFSRSLLRSFSTAPQDASPGHLHSWTLTLERGIGKAYGSDAGLQVTGAFRGEIFPDLPIATTWQNLGRALGRGLLATATADHAPNFTHYTTRLGALKVITIAANLRSEYDIERRVVAAAGEGVEAGGGQRAAVLLCVSGSHPVRSLPVVSRFLRSSLDTLRVAERLRSSGYIPPDTQLWVVANPHMERNAALLEVKASLGASAVLTQPPLDWPAYLAWKADAERKGLLRPAPPPVAAAAPILYNPEGQGGMQSGSGAEGSGECSRSSRAGGTGGHEGDSNGLVARGDGMRLLVGHPVISSAANLAFWITLSGCGGAPAAQALLSQALRAEAAGKEAALRYCESYNRELVTKVLEHGGVAGMHIMPIPKASKSMVMDMLADGSLPPSAK